MQIHAGLTLWCTCIVRAAINCVRSTSTSRTGKYTTKADEYTTETGKYINMKYLTWAIDYGYIGGMLYLLNTVMSEEKITVRNILLHQAANSILVCMLDVLKVISFSKHLANDIILLRKRLVQTFSINAVMLACFIQVNIDLMYWAPLNISQLVRVYLEYLVISFFKDKIAMQILVGPLLFCSLTALLGGGSSFSIHYASFFLCVVCDQTVHNLDPPLRVPQPRSMSPQQDQTVHSFDPPLHVPQPRSMPPQQSQQTRRRSMLRRSSDYVIPLPRILEGNQENENKTKNDGGLFDQRNNDIIGGDVIRAITAKERRSSMML